LRLERDIGLHIAYRQVCLNAIEYLKKFAGLLDSGNGAELPLHALRQAQGARHQRMLSERAEDRRRT
jgi:hypothetical protein